MPTDLNITLKTENYEILRPCLARTKKGPLCQNQAAEGEKYCKSHLHHRWVHDTKVKLGKGQKFITDFYN